MGKYNYVFSGKVIPITAPRNVDSGEGILIGDLFGIVGNTVLEGEATELYLDGVYKLRKAQGTITVGQRLYWNEAGGWVTTEAEGNKLIGASIENVGITPATVEVRLNGVSVA
jgi:predicted RecA/RadA family phage recombinase